MQRDNIPKAAANDESASDLRVTLTVDNFVNSYGLQPHFKPTLKSFVKHHDIKGPNKKHSNAHESSGPSGMVCVAFMVAWAFWPLIRILFPQD